MHIVPVIDIMNGRAVRGVAGRRDEYRPLSSPLCASADPADVLSAYLGLYSFEVLYVADLDGIERERPNVGLLDALHEAWPGICVWLDAGTAAQAGLESLGGRPWLRPVLGSESQQSLESFIALVCAAPRLGLGVPLLSLDFDGERFRGPGALLDARDAWPADVIVMTLERVGVNAGPGVSRLHSLKQADASARCYYAAGGLRGADDLPALRAAGAAGVLVASALHDGRLAPDDIAAAERGASGPWLRKRPEG